MKLIIKITMLEQELKLDNYGLYVPRIGETVRINDFETDVSKVIWNYNRGLIIVICE